MQQLADLFMWVSLFVCLPALVYMAKHPYRKGEPYGIREHKLLWISVLLSAGFMVAALVVRYGSP